ncbi:phage holin family protein [Variovorax sp.]|uniref:phage holin family protein n=1 Tax=Variovorax sp. TaxID=1871043 RepID=UPI002D272016|nr:phage holin family protein [Variovorax sp.]HYP84902.1 phage holin family protein [Variovorax sp.]
MLHPIYTTVLGHPELVADHLANYVALVREEAGDTARRLVARTIAGVTAVIAAMMALGLIGIAVMLGVLHGQFNWVLVIVPGVAVVIALVGAYIATRPADLDGFKDIRAQLDADVEALHLAGQYDER